MLPRFLSYVYRLKSHLYHLHEPSFSCFSAIFDQLRDFTPFIFLTYVNRRPPLRSVSAYSTFEAIYLGTKSIIYIYIY